MASRRPKKKIDQPKIEGLGERLNRRYKEASRRKFFGVAGCILIFVCSGVFFFVTFWLGIDFWRMALGWWH